MNSCPLCDGSVSTERPRHRVVLEVEDRTRSTKQFMGDKTDIKRYCVNQQVCVDCWDDLRENLS